MHGAYCVDRVSVVEPPSGLCPLGAEVPMENCRQNSLAAAAYAGTQLLGPARVGVRPPRGGPPRVGVVSRHGLRRPVEARATFIYRCSNILFRRPRVSVKGYVLLSTLQPDLSTLIGCGIAPRVESLGRGVENGI